MSRLSSLPTVLGEPLGPAVVLRIGAVVLLTTAVRLVYPLAVALVGSTHGRAAVALVGTSLGISLVRGFAVESSGRAVRRVVFKALARAIRRYPAVGASNRAPEEIESEIARGAPWVEAYFGQALPSAFGNALALPVPFVLAVKEFGLRPTAIVALAVGVGTATAVWSARAASRSAELAWDVYQGVARLVETGMRGRLELRAHGLATAHETRLVAAVDTWSAHERRASLLAALTGWSLPVAATAATLLLAEAAGIDAVDVLVRTVESPDRSLVLAGLLGLASLPIVTALSRGLADLAAERAYVRALARFVGDTEDEPELQRVAGDAEPGTIRLADAQFEYPGASVRADFAWHKGESLALIGANGSGKTTVSWLVLGVLEPSSGSVEIELEDRIESARYLVGRVGYLPQSSYFEDRETVREAIELIAGPEAIGRARDLLSELLAGGASEVASVLDRRVTSLSAGERRIVALARVLARDASVLVLDEPEANLDVDARSRVVSVLTREMTQRRMLLITHSPEFVALADRVLRFDGSHTVTQESGDPSSTRRVLSA